jgi:hypothetical protein
MAAAVPSTTTAGVLHNNNSSATTAALVQFLRSEADAAERQALSLRAQAAQWSLDWRVSRTDVWHQRYETMMKCWETTRTKHTSTGISTSNNASTNNAAQLPPIDSTTGLPKYMGLKRGRKMRERKRRANPARGKRQHTAYTLFVKETYPLLRQEHVDWPSKDIISLVAKQWSSAVSVEDKKVWKERALATHRVSSTVVEEEEEDQELVEDEVPDEEEAVDEEEEDGKVVPQIHDETDDDTEDDNDDDEEDELDDEEEEAAPPARSRAKTK